MDTDDLLTITRALTEDERRLIIDRFTAANPHWRGAGAADIIAAIYDADGYLNVIEPFWDAHEDELPDEAATAYAIRVVVALGRPLTVAAVHRILGLAELAGITRDFYYTTPGMMVNGPMTSAEAIERMDILARVYPAGSMKLLRLEWDYFYLPPNLGAVAPEPSFIGGLPGEGD